jgi:hypothetical protein
MRSLKKFVALIALASTMFSTVNAGECQVYNCDPCETTTCCTGYAEGRTISTYAPALAVGAIALVAIVAIACSNGGGGHGHGHGH